MLHWLLSWAGRVRVQQPEELKNLFLQTLEDAIDVIGGYLFASLAPDVKTALDIRFKMAPPLGVAFWMGLFWRHTTPTGAWAATIVGFGAWWLAVTNRFVA